MRAFWDLYKKEINTILFFSVVTILIIFAWELFLFYKANSWPEGLPFGLGFLPFSFFHLLLLWLGYNSYRQEWKDDTSYFILSLPRHGWEISLAKLAAGMSYLTVTTIFTITLIYFFQRNFIGTIFQEAVMFIPINWIISTLFKTYLAFWLSALYIYIIAQFSQLISLFYDRLRGLISIITFILSQYLVIRGGSLLAPILKWLPDIPVQIINYTRAGGLEEYTLYIGSAPLIGSAVITLILFFTGSWLLENYLEV
ncbi:MAG TPA: hypothetical protein VKY40_03045 [Halanaerobiales bacterium]|nr:hypothetical protein [Halanaerobiales bacterium]